MKAISLAACFVAGLLSGAVLYHIFLAERSYSAGYQRALDVMKMQFEKVTTRNTMFYSEDLGVVFVSKGGDTFEVILPDKLQ